MSTPSKPRPEATILAVDPSVNPDADLLVGKPAGSSSLSGALRLIP